ncbi:MAG: hypothetical protein WCT04_13470 [Planctomycetota bacterium]
MQLIVTCAGCGAKYRGESGPKKFRCAACSNLFTFPEQPKTASAGTILCSNCWTETVPTEKLKTCGFCSQRVSPRYGGLAAEDKQVKVKQPSVRNDPNLLKAATNPHNSSGEIPAGGGPRTESNGNVKFTSDEWKEIGGESKQESVDSKKTQAFELMAELKKELEPEMQSVVASMMKSQEIKIDRSTLQQHAPSDSNPHMESSLPHQPHLHPTGEQAILAPTPTNTGIAPLHSHPQYDAEKHETQSRLNAIEQQLAAEIQSREKLLGERNTLEVKVADLEGRLIQEQSMRQAASSDGVVRDLQAKVSDLSNLAAADKRSKEQMIQERMQLEELWRERDAKVAELTARLNSDTSTRAAINIERDELRAFKRDHEAKQGEIEAHFFAERKANETLQYERNQLLEKLAELESSHSELKSAHATHINSLAAMQVPSESLQEMEARIADLDTRLGNEKKSKDTLLKERDSLSDNRRELQARIADLESRLNAERADKENLSRKHNEHLDARNELDAKVVHLESRFNSEREAKEIAAAEREKLHEVRLELEARTADLTRRHTTEKEAKERLVREHSDLANAHRELNAKITDFKTRLKAEQDVKDSARKERDELMAQLEASEARASQGEAEVTRLRKSIQAQLEKFGAEYNSILGKLAERTSDLVAHAALTRKRLDEAVLHHGDKIELAAADLQSKLQHESVELGAKLKKMMQEHESRDSARLAAQSAASNGSTVAVASTTSSSSSGRFPSGPQKPVMSPNEGSDSVRIQHQAAAPEHLVAQPDNTSGSGSRNEVPNEGSVGGEGSDKSSGTFWAKVFKRPQTKP